MEDLLTESGPHENPLVPNSKLRQMYVAMVEARILDEHIAGLQRKVKARRRLASTYGQEACRVSTAIELGEGDLVGDAQLGVAMERLFGTKVDSLLARVATLTSGAKKQKGVRVSDGAAARILPWVEDAEDRLRMATGAALALKTLGKGKLVVAYALPREVGRGVWKDVLTVAAKLELPIIFVLLPEVRSKTKKNVSGDLSGKARVWGVPGIPVDANDAVALYRVAQESIGRVRGGDGPVLMECVRPPLLGARGEAGEEPIARMRSFLLAKKICSEAWLAGAGETFRRRITGAKL